jgi:hypothetical protein
MFRFRFRIRVEKHQSISSQQLPFYRQKPRMSKIFPKKETFSRSKDEDCPDSAYEEGATAVRVNKTPNTLLSNLFERYVLSLCSGLLH